MKLALIASLAVLTSGTMFAQVVNWDVNGKILNDPSLPVAEKFAWSDTGNVSIGDWTAAEDWGVYRWGTGFGVPGPMAASNFFTVAYLRDDGYEDFDLTGNYVSFSLSADSGYQVNLTGISFSTYELAWTQDYNTKGVWAYRVIEDGDYGLWTTHEFSVLHEATIQEWEFANPLITSGTVEFAFQAFGELDPSMSGDVRISVISPGDGMTPGFQVHGSVEAIPEPSTMLLLGAGAAFLAWRRMGKA